MNPYRLLFTLALILAPFGAFGQVRQSGTVTPGHPSVWITNGVIGDPTSGGTALNTLPVVGLGGTPLTVSNYNVTNPGGYAQLGLGVSNSAGVLSLSGTGSYSSLPLNVSVNGNTAMTISASGAVSFPSGVTLPAGGLSGQVQYNNGGVLGGLTGITVSAGAVQAIQSPLINTVPFVASNTYHQMLFGFGVPSTIVTNATAFGYKALASGSATLGIDEVAFGPYTLTNDLTGAENTAIGDHALANCTNCNNNTAVGSSAVAAMNSGTFNTGIGVSAMQDATGSPTNNTAVGVSALNALTTGANFNDGFGDQAGFVVSTGTHNTIIGSQSFYYLTTGSYNVGVGYNAASLGTSGLITGSQNTFLGASTYADTDPTNSTAIGYNSRITASNQIVLGNTAITQIKAGPSLPPTAGMFNVTTPVLHGVSLALSDGSSNSLYVKHNTGPVVLGTDPAGGMTLGVNGFNNGLTLSLSGGSSGNSLAAFGLGGTTAGYTSQVRTNGSSTGGGYFIVQANGTDIVGVGNYSAVLGGSYNSDTVLWNPGATSSTWIYNGSLVAQFTGVTGGTSRAVITNGVGGPTVYGTNLGGVNFGSAGGTTTLSDALVVLSAAGYHSCTALTTNSAGNVGCSSTAIPVSANPSASVGLSAVNGTAATFMRSDAAPALSQAITPTWTGLHIFSNGLTVSSGATSTQTLASTTAAFGGATIGSNVLAVTGAVELDGVVKINGTPPTSGQFNVVSAVAGGISGAFTDNVNNSLYIKHTAGGAIIGTDAGGLLRLGSNGFTVAMTITATQDVVFAGTPNMGTYTGSTCTNVGYITLKDSGGTPRKFMICS